MNWRFWQRTDTSGTTARQQTPVDEERLRISARRRLIGAGVLVLLTVLIFPWVFESQPRPVDDNIVIEIPRKDAVKPLAAPAALPLPAPSAAVPGAATPPKDNAANPPIPAVVTNDMRKEDSGKPADSAPSKPATEAAALAKEPKEPAADAQPKPAAKPAAADGAAGVGQKGRFVVQVGAFTDAAKVRELRLKIEKAGLKTYSQAVDTPKGRVWRVRVGPFDNRAAAEKAKAELVLQGYAPGIIEL
jgi:DedD protein